MIHSLLFCLIAQLILVVIVIEQGYELFGIVFVIMQVLMSIELIMGKFDHADSDVGAVVRNTFAVV
jgi:hypothetical protein